MIADIESRIEPEDECGTAVDGVKAVGNCLRRERLGFRHVRIVESAGP